MGNSRMRTRSAPRWIWIEFLQVTSRGARADGMFACRIAGTGSSDGLALPGTAWAATATAAATVRAVRALRQRYGNEVDPESKKVSRR